MKKKGLIVSTVVMVVVLIASLTTATYAWFSTTKTTTIAPIEFSVGAGSDVSIGLKDDNTYTAQAPSGSFVSGSTKIGVSYVTTVDGKSVPLDTKLQAGTGYWIGDPGLGSKIDMQLSLAGMEKAVGTGKVGGTADGAFDFSAIRTLATAENKGVIMSEGIGTTPTANGASVAVGQKNYLDVVIGVQAAATDLYSIICNVTINPDAADIDLGMNAAIHVAWSINGMISADTPAAQKVDAYGAKGFGTTTLSLGKTLVGDNTNTINYGGNAEQTLNNGAVNVPITVAASATGTGTDYLARADIYQLHLLIWIDGNDPDCNDQAKGVSSKIYINFSTTHAARTNPTV